MHASGWMDVWPLSLASFPTPHVAPSLRPNVDQDRKPAKRMVLLRAASTPPTEGEQKTAELSAAGIVSLACNGYDILTAQTLQTRTPEANRTHAVISYVMISVSLCSSPHRVDIWEHKPSVSEYTRR